MPKYQVKATHVNGFCFPNGFVVSANKPVEIDSEVYGFEDVAKYIGSALVCPGASEVKKEIPVIQVAKPEPIVERAAPVSQPADIATVAAEPLVEAIAPAAEPVAQTEEPKSKGKKNKSFFAQ